MGERVIGVEPAKKIPERWLLLDFIDDPSTAKVNAFKELEAINFN